AAEVPYGTPIKVGNYTLQIDPARGEKAPAPPPRPAMRMPGPTLPPPTRIPTQTELSPLVGKAPPPPAPPQVTPQVTAPPPAKAEAVDDDVSLRREIHKMLLENLDLATLDPSKLDDPSMRPRVLTALRRIVTKVDARIAPAIDRDVLI